MSIVVLGFVVLGSVFEPPFRFRVPVSRFDEP